MTLDDDDVVQFTADEAAELQTDLRLSELAAAGDQMADVLLQLSDLLKDSSR